MGKIINKPSASQVNSITSSNACVLHQCNVSPMGLIVLFKELAMAGLTLA